MKNYDEQLAELQQKINKLKNEKEAFESLTPRQRLAELIHDKQCRWNHTDGCGWFYEKWDSVGHSKGEYLKKADAILEITNYETAEKIISKL